MARLTKADAAPLEWLGHVVSCYRGQVSGPYKGYAFNDYFGTHRLSL